MLGIKPEAVALALGEDWSPKKISQLEEKETVPPELLQQISTIFKVPVEAFRSTEEFLAFNVISNTFQDFKDHAIASANQCSFNPIDKVIELYDDKIALYERMLKEKDEMMARLERLIEKK